MCVDRWGSAGSFDKTQGAWRDHSKAAQTHVCVREGCPSVNLFSVSPLPQLAGVLVCERHKIHVCTRVFEFPLTPRATRDPGSTMCCCRLRACSLLLCTAHSTPPCTQIQRLLLSFPKTSHGYQYTFISLGTALLLGLVIYGIPVWTMS